MKILSQDKKSISDVSREVYTTLWDYSKQEYAVMNKSHRATPLGVYHTEARATEIIGEIFEGVITGMSTYKMPEE